MSASDAMSALEMNAFQLSRVYGQGWTAAKTLLAGGRAAGAAQSAKLNPYRDGEERARWGKGFDDALMSRPLSHHASHASGWRPFGKTQR